MNALLMSGVMILLMASMALLAVRHAEAGRAARATMSLERGPDGELAVPVSGLLKGAAKNSLRPSLAITSDGVRFRVLWEERWTFGEIERVDAGKTLLGASLQFVGRGKGTLVAYVDSVQVAAQVLAALPSGVPLTDRATGLRDGAGSG